MRARLYACALLLLAGPLHASATQPYPAHDGPQRAGWVIPDYRVDEQGGV